MPARREAPRPALPAALLLGTLLVGAPGCGGPPAVPPARAGARPAPVTVVAVARGPVVQRVEGTGSLEAVQVVVVPARVDGVVEELGCHEGDAVDPARMLAVVDGRRRRLAEAEAAAAVAQARAALPRAAAAAQRAEAGVARARAQAGAAATDLAEAQEVLARREAMRQATPGVVPEEEIALKRAQVARMRDAQAGAASALAEAEGAQAEALALADEARAALATAEARLSLAQLVLADTVVRPPIAGVVRRRHVTLGQYVRAGEPVAEIVDRSRLNLRFRVTEAESVPLATGMDATFLVPSLSGEAHRARLVHVDAAASPVTRMVECLAEVLEPDARLKPGFFAVASVEARRSDGLAVPELALLPGENGWVAYVVEEGKARQRRVVPGLRGRDGSVEVLDGLRAGDTLVVGGANVLSDGTPVAVREAGAAPR